MLHIKLFPAEYGDCIILSIGKESQYNILIDGGLSKTYHKYIKAEIQHIKELGQKIGLMVCTHMDNDHIIASLHTTHPQIISRFLVPSNC